MPTYQYACTACGNQLEAVQSFTDDPLTQCPACDGQLRKLFSSVGIVFKGSGFYRTDSRAAAPVGADSSTAKSGESGAGSDSGAATGTGADKSGEKSGDKSSGGTKPKAETGGNAGESGGSAAKSTGGEGKGAKNSQKATAGIS